MQLIETLEALSAVLECAETHGHNNELRLAWISHRAAEALAVARGDYAGAEAHKIQCNALAALMRMDARAGGHSAAVKPIVIGGETAGDADEAAIYENLIGRSVWYRPVSGDQQL